MSRLLVQVKRSTLPVLIVLCLAALTVSYAYAEGSLRPLATVIIGDPDAAVTGKLAVGTATPGNKALTVVGVIDFLGAGTVHNFFTQGPGNNMQIRSNVDETNTVYDATRSQWNMVMGSSNDMFMIKHSPAGATYNEDSYFWIQGSTGNVGIATFDTLNGAVLPFAPRARLDVVATSMHAIRGETTDSTSYGATGVYGRSASSGGNGMLGRATSPSGVTWGVGGVSDSDAGTGVYGLATSTTGVTYGIQGESDSTEGTGVYGYTTATTGGSIGVRGQSDSYGGWGVWGSSHFGVVGQSASSAQGRGVWGYASANSGMNSGVYGESASTAGFGVFGKATATIGGPTYGVKGQSDTTFGYGVYGIATATTGDAYGVFGVSASSNGAGVLASATATSGTTYGVYAASNSPSGYGVYFTGGLAGTGTKSAIVETEDYGWRHLYAMESPQNWFEDFGQATLSAGEADVTIEPIFAQTVNLDEDYHVFLTPRGDCGLYVAEQTESSFTVHALNGATCEIAFDYRIIASRLDYEDLRLKEAEDPEAVAASMPEAPSAPAVP